MLLYFVVDGDINLPVFLVDQEVNLPVLLFDTEKAPTF